MWIVFGILCGMLFYIKMEIVFQLVNYFGIGEPSLYVIGQVLRYPKQRDLEGDGQTPIKLVPSLRANQLLPLSWRQKVISGDVLYNSLH